MRILSRPCWTGQVGEKKVALSPVHCPKRLLAGAKAVECAQGYAQREARCRAAFPSGKKLASTMIVAR